MKAIRPLLIVVALLIGQAQASQYAFLCRDGAVCNTCTTSIPDACCPAQPAVKTPNQDCKSCCVVAPIGQEQPPKSAAHHVLVEIECILSPIQLFVAQGSVDPVWYPINLATPYLPHAPPGTTASRAPPPPAAA